MHKGMVNIAKKNNLEKRRQTGGDTKEKIKQVNKGNTSALTRKRKYLLIWAKGLILRTELGSEF